MSCARSATLCALLVGIASLDAAGVASSNKTAGKAAGKSCDGVLNDAACETWFNNGQPLYPAPRRPRLHLERHLAVKQPKKVKLGDFETLVVIASCTKSDAYNTVTTRKTLRLLRANVRKPLIVAAACRKLSAKHVALLDAVLHAPCSAMRGYDAGLWQQGLRWALATGLLGMAQYCVLINDSVIGPYFNLTANLRNGVTFAAIWVQSGELKYGSAAVTMYGPDVLRSHVFVDYWNASHFFCGKWGSMRLLESALMLRYLQTGFACWTYSHSIYELSWPNKGNYSTALPFYKHKNPPYDLHSLFSEKGPAVVNLQIDQQAEPEKCGVRDTNPGDAASSASGFPTLRRLPRLPSSAVLYQPRRHKRHTPPKPTNSWRQLIGLGLFVLGIASAVVCIGYSALGPFQSDDA